MKRLVVFSMLILVGMAVLASCEKEGDKEWNKFYGYAKDDIVGEYAFSNLSDAFDGLMESDEGHLCPDAQVNVSATGDQTVLFHMASASCNFQRNFSGRTTLNANDFLISMYSGWVNLKRYNVTAEVLKNKQDAVRLKGYVSEDRYERVYNTEEAQYDTVYDYSIKYYFDVTKN
ncbi:MAG: hypothetical protein IJP44_05235 [Bacteroidales bacterium]|nr:hypothetical protein [Bacteroidales bacterium]